MGVYVCLRKAECMLSTLVHCISHCGCVCVELQHPNMSSKLPTENNTRTAPSAVVSKVGDNIISR